MVSHQPSLVSHPLAQLAAALALGILAARLMSIPSATAFGGGAVTSLLAVGALSRRRAGTATCFVTVAFFWLGTALLLIETRNVPANQLKRLITNGTVASGDPVELTGVLDRPPELGPDCFYLTLNVERLRSKGAEQSASGVVMFVVPVGDQRVEEEYRSLELRYGARVRVMTTLNRSDNFRNPGVASFTEYLDGKGYDAAGVIKSPLQVERLADERVFLPLAWLYQWRQKVEWEIRLRFSSDTAGVLDAALLGNRYNLSQETAERFREGGTFHVLVISGLHISFIGGMFFIMARWLSKRRSWQFALPAAGLWAYAIAVGAGGSVVRAALMFSLVTLAPVVSRRAGSLNALGGAALVLLVWRPSALFDISLQLTFLSVLAIVVLAWPLLQRMSETGSWRPTRETPQPPACAQPLRTFCEILFWSDRQWRREIALSSYSYLLFKTPLAKRLEQYHLQRFLRYAVSTIVVSASVQLGLLPLMIRDFHRLSLASIILNIGVGLMMALLGLTALAALLVGQISATIAAPLVALANLLNWLMVHSVDLFSRAGPASLRLPEYTGGAASVYLVYYFPLTVLVLALVRWKPVPSRVPEGEVSRSRRVLVRFAAALQVIMFLLVVLHPLSSNRPDGRLRMDFLDVGQGDSALVTMPDGVTLLIDGGGRPNFLASNRQSEGAEEEPFQRDQKSIGEAVVSEYLWERGLSQVDFILATHADADHIDGLNDVARNFRVRAAFVARTPHDDREYRKFAATLSENGIPLQVIGAGDVLHFGNVSASVLWPLPLRNSDSPSRNNDSVVLRLRFGERTMVLTGDVEKEGEAAILGAKNDLKADIVKVPHHGSKTSSTEGFVAATRPRLAVVSVGLTSIFGHPNRQVVNRWRAAGAEVMTTGRRGTITVTTDGRDLQVKTFVQE